MPRRYLSRHHTTIPMTNWVKAAVGTVIALGLASLLDQVGGAPLLAAPLGASAVLVLGMPESPLSQPAHVIGGHLVATLIGLAFDLLTAGGGLSLAMAVAVTMLALVPLRLTHPPACATPVVVMMTHPGWEFLVMTILMGSLILVAVAVLLHRLPPRAVYPLPVHPGGKA